MVVWPAITLTMYAILIIRTDVQVTCYPIEMEEDHMMWTIAVVLIILWLLGFVSNYTMGGFIHILLVIAIVVVLIRIIQGRKPL